MAVLAESFKKALANVEPQRKEEGDDAKTRKLPTRRSARSSCETPD